MENKTSTIIYQEEDYRIELKGETLHVHSSGQTSRGTPLFSSSRIESILPVHHKAGATNSTHFRVGPGLYRMGARLSVEMKIAELQKIAERREAKMAENLPGLNELRSAGEDEDRYQGEFRRMMEDQYNDGVHPPRRPTANIEELQKQFPAAAAYLRCERIADSAHWSSGKARSFREAAESILDGADWEDAEAKASETWGKEAARAGRNS